MTKEAVGIWPGRKTKDRNKCVRVGRGTAAGWEGADEGAGRGRPPSRWTHRVGPTRTNQAPGCLNARGVHARVPQGGPL